MAMLAEPRRKVKWTLNPRGKFWSEDSNKFGQRMLEKMGWSPGKGLGAHEQGSTSHIGVKLKTDNRGVGYGGKDTDWCKHQTKFEEVLADLGQNMEAVGSETTITSLEKISKQSKSRLHYHKFTRGKDLTQYSKKDLDCILGKKDKGDEVPSEEQTVTQDPGDRDDSFGIVTVLGGSVEDYLKKKKWHSKTIAGTLSERVRCDGGSTVEKNGWCFEAVEENNLPHDSERGQSASFKAKKNKRKKKASTESVSSFDVSTERKNLLCIEAVEGNNLPCDRLCDLDIGERLKKKKSKKSRLSESIGCFAGSMEGMKGSGRETDEENNVTGSKECNRDVCEKPKKKSKKKPRVELDNVDNELSEVVSLPEAISEKPEKKIKRKRKHNMNTDNINVEGISETLEKDEFRSHSEEIGKIERSRGAKEYIGDDSIGQEYGKRKSKDMNSKQLCDNVNIRKYFKCFDKKDSLKTFLPSAIQMFPGSNLSVIEGYGCKITGSCSIPASTDEGKER